MSGGSGVHPLIGEQRDAVDPLDSVWLSASAGTGKTQVLSSRILRLLLREDVSPEQILALTFTKAGAAEMADRVNATLARWVRMAAVPLAEELDRIGAPGDPETRARARRLFARVLDCAGGGLKIETIHAFSQWLLAAFPQEAGITVGARAMEDRDRSLLMDEVLASLLTGRAGPRFAEALAELSLRYGADGAKAWLMRCADARDLWFGPHGWRGDLEPRVNRLLGLPSDASETDLETLCGDPPFDLEAVRELAEHYAGWKAQSGVSAREALTQWDAGSPAVRAAGLDALNAALFHKNGNAKLPQKADKAFRAASRRAGASLEACRTYRRKLEAARDLVPAFAAGREFAVAWDAEKRRQGLVDFDDQIALAAELLSNRSMSDWIRYKLDRRFDHLLIDEAQDTNADQWTVIKALTDDFFDGVGQREGRQRTLFVVGDYKQAIFAFQGTSPENFRRARNEYDERMQRATAGSGRARGGQADRKLEKLGLERSFRSAQPILDFVDAALDRLGHASLGLVDPAGPHRGLDLPGLVRMWEPVVQAAPETAESDADEKDHAVDAGLTGTDRELAERIARQCRRWIDQGYPLAKKKRMATAGDIMVLVRKRRDLAGLIVARLHANGVPVAGVDRLRLGAPLAVQDCLAALRFAAQPGDDLSLASLLVSPLIGWSQDSLLENALRPRGASLWRHLADSETPMAREALDRLRPLLAQAEYATPLALLEWMLTGPWDGRRRIVARLGSEANDPLDELLNAAAGFEARHTASLPGFLRWFESSDADLKREAEKAGERVRVMTVHGAKGLQAPLVILADATGDPTRPSPSDLEATVPMGNPMGRGLKVPLPPMRKAELVGPLAAAMEERLKRDLEEHWRLLYVAMTRAEEGLFIGGALGKQSDAPPPESWYAALRPLFGDEAVEDPIFGTRLDRGHPATAAPAAPNSGGSVPDLPRWTLTPAPLEPSPARPLAPSAVGEDDSAQPPSHPSATREAARRGVALHALLERLPSIGRDARAGAAARWLARHAEDLSPEERAALAADALQVIDDPTFAPVFAPGSLAEVPLTARIGDAVVQGTVDRLVLDAERVLIVDYKTTRRPPAALGDVPPATLRQMAAYVAAIEAIYPGRRVEAAVLYTHAPRLIAIPSEALASA